MDISHLREAIEESAGRVLVAGVDIITSLYMVEMRREMIHMHVLYPPIHDAFLSLAIDRNIFVIWIDEFELQRYSFSIAGDIVIVGEKEGRRRPCRALKGTLEAKGRHKLILFNLDLHL